MITLISHFYNEEYLLPFWIDYHKRIFKDAILIDYGSSDNSINIINKLAPNWKIIKSRNSFFQADLVDKEVMDIEQKIEGWKICLNTTEFLMSSKKLDSILNEKAECYAIKQYLVCDKSYKEPNNTKIFISNLNYGNLEFGYGYRYIHKLNNNYTYGVGRHEFFGVNYKRTSEIFIGHCRYYPWNNEQIKRKLSFKKMIPQSDINMNRGYQHLYTIDELINKEKEAKLNSYEITDENFLKCHEYAKDLF